MSNSKFQKKITESLNNVLEQTIENRQEYYNDHDYPELDSVNNLINSISYKNAAVATASSLIPGPWGMISLIPEITIIIRNQIQMVYDIGLAYGHKKEQLQTNLIVGIVLAGIGNGALGLITIHGNKILIKRSGLRLAQKLITALGGRITQQVAKTALAKWVPLAGAAAIGTWTKYSTSKIGQKAVEIFSKTIVYQEEELTEETSFQEINDTIGIERLQILINLMKIDGEIAPEEIKLINQIIESSNLIDSEKNALKDEYRTDKPFIINYESIKEDEKIGILLDLLRLANIDNHFKESEDLFIKDYCRKLNINIEDFETLKHEVLNS